MLLWLHGNFSHISCLTSAISLAYCPLASQQNFSNLNIWEMIQIMPLLFWHFPLWSQISEGHNILCNPGKVPGKPAGVIGSDFIDLEANKHCFTQLALAPLELQPYLLLIVLLQHSNLSTWEMIQIVSQLLWHFPLWSQISQHWVNRA